MTRRPAYTLLEVLLALGIATFMLGGLYVSMDVQLRLAQAGRDRVDDAAVAKAVLARLATDVSAVLTPIRAAATSGTPSGASATGSTTTTDAEAAVNLNAVTPLNGGVIGDADRLILFVSRAPGAQRGAADADALPNGGADLRRVSWWLAAEGGLARQEIARVTADDEMSQLPPDVPNERGLVIAPEVSRLQFQFFDGSGWVDQWDGTVPGEDGVTPLGPPRAVRVSLSVRSMSNPDVAKNHVFVVAIPAANAQPVAATTEDTP
jgi:type II secretory pathway component PulJ